jgi:hypothetical protein
MLLDAQLLFSDGQAVTTTANSTNVIDLLSNRDIGAGEDLWLVVVVTEAATAAGAATVTFTMETDDNISFSSATTIYTSPAIAKTALTLGARAIGVKVPRYTERYLRLAYTVATGPLTAGKFTAGITLSGSISDETRNPYARASYGVA